MPELANAQQVATVLFLQMLTPIVCEPPGIVLDSVESEAFQSKLLHDPRPPIYRFFYYLGIGVVNIFQHQVIGIAL